MRRAFAIALIVAGFLAAIVPALVDAETQILNMPAWLSAGVQTLAGAVIGAGFAALASRSQHAREARLDCEDIDRTLEYLRENREASYDKATKATVVDTLRLILRHAEITLISARGRIASRAELDERKGDR